MNNVRNELLDKMLSDFDDTISDSYLEHYGMPRRSGRYPYGSGKDPYQHSSDFLSRVKELEKKGLSEKEIADSFNHMTTAEYNLQKKVAKHEQRQLEVDRAKALSQDGKGPSEIAKIMSPSWDGKTYNESSIRSLLSSDSEVNKNRAVNTADILRKEIKEKGMLDVGEKSELAIPGISKGILDEAVYRLEMEGYNRYPIGIPTTTNKSHTIKTIVLADPELVGKDYKEGYAYVYNHRGDIKTIGSYASQDGGLKIDKVEYPKSLSSKRIKIVYGDEMDPITKTLGVQKDGTIEIRRGVEDLSLGNSTYAQVRILVDGTHYMKGMAYYRDDMPPGVDVIYNVNKPKGTPMMGEKKSVLKAIDKTNPNNPFGAQFKAEGQYHYIDKDGKRQLGVVNKLKAEGEWNEHDRKSSSQFISKQPLPFIKNNLNQTLKDYEAQYEKILKVENPTIRRKMLEDFAGTCDSAVTTLKSAALPRQKVQVLLPVPNMKDNEVYAPNYKNGEHVVLIRYPHGGTFEIPDLVVNNKNKYAVKTFGNLTDAIGINLKTAEKLSGADFDGDFVSVIPANNPGGKVKVVTRPSLEGLKDFDPKTAYPHTPGAKIMPKNLLQKQMGTISNLITDMTLQNAPDEDIVKAVKHSMVVVDSPKHKLDYRKSEKDNSIDLLKKKYQPHDNDSGHGGAWSLLSKRKQTVEVPETIGGPDRKILKETGKIVYNKESGRTYVDPKTGKTKLATKTVKLLEITDDLNTLTKGTPIEKAYADYGNSMKALANRARKETFNPAHKQIRDPEAAKKYASEVDSLKAKIDVSSRNQPKERIANAVANQKISLLLENNPDLKNDTKALKKQKNIAINEARELVGADSKNTKFNVTDKEWEAIQAGAVSDTLLTEIYRRSNQDRLKSLAMPSTRAQLNATQKARVKALNDMGYDNSEIAMKMGVSTDVISNIIHEEG